VGPISRVLYSCVVRNISKQCAFLHVDPENIAMDAAASGSILNPHERTHTAQ
jgi:hypothetical protein